jgi:hypothetical protein
VAVSQSFGSGDTLPMNLANLRAMEKKIAAVLRVRPECFITHPAELATLNQLSAEELEKFAIEHGWRVVSRLGGRQIEFYNDVGAQLAREG